MNKEKLTKSINSVFHLIQLQVADMSMSADVMITDANASNRITKENSAVLHGLANSLAVMQEELEKESSKSADLATTESEIMARLENYALLKGLVLQAINNKAN